ncbi:MAG TPA: hypothetical protein VFJ71_03300 [Candidatus Limnocylindrales bacterium]|nr:hypothetical protein [Candidatus Limnocylindrales bacterium]
MSSPVTPATRVPQAAARRLRRHLGLPARRAGSSAEAVAGRLELVVTLAAIVAMSAVVPGPVVWLIAALVLAGTILATLQLLADVDVTAADSGIPVEALLVPAVAALGAVGVIRVVPLGLAVVGALVLVAILIDRVIAVETQIAASPDGAAEDDRPRALAAMLVVALVAFVGVAAIVPNGLAGTAPDGSPAPPLPIGDLALLALADAVVAGLLGYRAAALRLATARDALWASVTSAVAIALGAAALRAMGIPRLIGPALLMLLFYLWDSVHAAPSARRRDPRWIWETVVLAGLGAAIAFWNLRLVG